MSKTNERETMKTKKKPVEKKLFSVTIENVVTAKDLDYVLDSAFGPSGCHYWVEDVIILDKKDGEYLSQIVVKGGKLQLVHDEGKTAVLDLEAVRRGIPLLCKHTGKTWKGFCENYDGPAADTFVQLCLFGEILYC